MKLLFWNLYNKENSTWLSELVKEYKPDIIIMAEYKNLDIKKFRANNSEYSLCVGMGVDSKVAAMTINPYSVKVFREQGRYTMYSVENNNNVYNLIGLHLPANPTSDFADRMAVIGPLVSDIVEMERIKKNDKTIVIGDFNASPFDSELINKNMFNAVLFKDLIYRKEYDHYNRYRYRRFYNPALTLLSEQDKCYGSFYYSNGVHDLHWYSYDQVLVRKCLCKSLKDIRYIRKCGNKSMCKKSGLPDKNKSDHFPIYVEVQYE